MCAMEILHILMLCSYSFYHTQNVYIFLSVTGVETNIRDIYTKWLEDTPHKITQLDDL